MSVNGEKGGAMRMRLNSRTAAALGLVAIFGLSSVGCSKIEGLKAKMASKQATEAYQAQDYKKAADLYEQTMADDGGDPAMNWVYFYLGNSYDNLYKPGLTTPANQELLTKAVQNYQMAADKLSASNPSEMTVKKLSLQYLAAAYGPDKLNDPAKAEPVIQDLIRLDPGDPAHYFELEQLYENAGVYDAAEKVLVMAQQAKPDDSSVYMQLAGFYKRQDDFPKTINALEERSQKDPNNPEALQTIAAYYQDEVRNDHKLHEDQKRDYIQKGLQASDHALQIKPDYVDAMIFKGLLLRLQAPLEKDPAKQQAILKQADQLRDQADALRKKQATGVSD